MISNSGSLTITVKEAILIKDSGFFTKMDPYMTIFCGGSEKRTTTKNEVGKHPKWNEVCFITLIPL